VRALLLDLDDTLLDYSGGVEHCWAGACADAAADVPQAALVTALAATRRSFWSDPEHNRRERVNMLRAWTSIATQALEQCGGDARLGAAIAEAFAARRHSVMTLFPDTLSFLTAVRERGIPLALVTNGDAREQRAKIERHALAPFFGAIVIEGEFGAGKPDAAVYRHALAALGTRPDATVMVGDNFGWDVAGARDAGLVGVYLDRAGRGLPKNAGSTRVIRSLAELI